MPDWQTLRIFMANVLINALVALLVGGATLSFSFEAETAGGAGSSVASGNSASQYVTQGTIVTDGEKYRMENSDAVVLSDGKVMCIYQRAIDEVILQEAAAGAAGIANPFAVLIGSDSNYDVAASDADAQGIPRKIVLKAKSGAKYTIRIKDYKKLPQVDMQQFVFRAEDFPTAVVTDLR
jgi:outer membrane lipoprotein-sorting protein